MTEKNEIEEIFERVKSIAIMETEKNGGSPSYAVLIRENASPMTFDFLVGDYETKESEMQALYLLCQSENAIAMALVAEAWMVLGEKNAREALGGVSPSKHPGRREVLTISLMTREAQKLETLEIDRFPDGRIRELSPVGMSSQFPGVELKGNMVDAFPLSPLPISERKKARDVAMKIRKKNRKGRR